MTTRQHETDTCVEQSGSLTELIGQGIEIAGDAVRLAPHRWGIYGSIPVDGNVLVAEYDTAEEARDAVRCLPSGPAPTIDLDPPAVGSDDLAR